MKGLIDILPKYFYPDQKFIDFKDTINNEVMAKFIIKPDTPHFKCPIVVLINEQTISGGESWADFIKSNRLAIFIGSPTAGTNGDIYGFRLPGGIYISFTLSYTLKTNGDEFWKSPISPDIYITPTLLGIMERKDEVLERAVLYLKQGN